MKRFPLRAWTLLVLAAAAAGTTGCQDTDAGGGTTRPPQPIATAFAPVVVFAPGEPWRPTSPRRFIANAVFGFAEDRGCPNRPIAVGRALPELQNPEIDWTFAKGLGANPEPNYERIPNGRGCELKLGHELKVYADQLTRPHDRGGDRFAGIRPGQGFYLDLTDSERRGPPGYAAPTFFEQTDEGDGRTRIAYWLLFGMDGPPGSPGSREGDWERIDVLVDVDDGRATPVAVETTPDGTAAAGDRRQLRRTPWNELQTAGGTHPVLYAERATHAMDPTPTPTSCDACPRLETWHDLRPARRQLWYGFGGAWGEVGDSDRTTGPLGPHRRWLDAEAKREAMLAVPGEREL